MASLTTHKTTSYAHGHVAFFYDSPLERTQLLAQYFSDGLKQGERCIVATSQPVEALVEDLCNAGLFVASALAHGSLQLLDMYDIYLPSGHFQADAMLDNVARFIQEARQLGYRGLRTASEMVWVTEHPESQVSAAGYEANVTQLGKQHGEFLGLCMYPTSNIDIVKDALRTHPAYIYRGRLQVNPFSTSHKTLPARELDSTVNIDSLLAAT